LTFNELEQLQVVKDDLQHEIFRAQGTKEQEQIEHHSENLDTVANISERLLATVLTIWTILDELKPW